MPYSSKGWFLHAATPDQNGQRGQLVKEDFELPDLAEDEVLAEPLFGGWEGNGEHALSRRHIDICGPRGEGRVILGNSGVVRVEAVGAGVRGLKPGQNAIPCGGSVLDRFGYPERMLAYDAPGTMGCLATRIKIKGCELLPVPAGTRYSLAQWAAFTVRYVTAWSNMELALGTFRLLVGVDEFPNPHVWGWGGGTTLAQLQLAQRWGCRTVMLSGHPPHLEQIRKAGITPVDRRPFGHLFFAANRYPENTSFRPAS